MKQDSFVTYFSESQIKGIDLPEKFTFPFYYQPHELTKIATQDLQCYLEKQSDIQHNFGIDTNQEGPIIGKMFGVLVVQDAQGKLGYLSAFSGKIGGSNSHKKFVPPVFDMLVEGSFFLEGQELLNQMNAQVKQIESTPEYQDLLTTFEKLSAEAKEAILAYKIQLRQNKNDRKSTRITYRSVLSPADYQLYEAFLIKQSLRDKYEFRVFEEQWTARLNEIRSKIAVFDIAIERLKVQRKEKSVLLQKQLFEQYSFLNIYRQTKSLEDIFKETVFEKPPAGAGECATPKLLQYAFLNQLKPIAMAEFWWGASPKSEIRKHKNYYPACTGKCQPILKHMLDGIQVEDNPLLHNPGENKNFEVVHEDDFFVVLNKPSDLLSVPGIHIKDSVYSRLKIMLNNAEPYMVHRLDMATSGLLVVAKSKEIHKNLQRQFLKQTVIKRYTALLSKVIEKKAGEIDLPLRGDLDDRPRQLVCFKHGKKSVTKYEVIEKTQQTTKVVFYPLTGRTHQLRMHAAHPMGLDAPIVGDDLYGEISDRLYLHASYLEFIHPNTNEKVSFEAKEPF